MNRFIVAITLAWGLAAPAAAQENEDWLLWPLAHKFVFEVGAFDANLDTLGQVNSSTGILGTMLDFEGNLGLTESKTVPTVHAAWRFAKKHTVSLAYFQIRRTGTEITDSTIRIGDTVFNADLPVSSEFDVDTINLAYYWSPVFDAKKELSLGFGLGNYDIRLALEGNEEPTLISTEEDLDLVVPTFSIAAGYAVTEKFALRGSFGYLSLELDLGNEDDLAGTVIEAGVLMSHQTFENVRFALGYSYFDIDADWTNKGKYTAIEYNYHGPHLMVALTF